MSVNTDPIAQLQRQFPYIAGGQGSREWRVIWRWREDDFNGYRYDERRRLFQTEAGARRHYDKLTSNDGRFTQDNEGGSDLRLEYARIEVRDVGLFAPVEGFLSMEPLP